MIPRSLHVYVYGSIRFSDGAFGGKDYVAGWMDERPKVSARIVLWCPSGVWDKRKSTLTSQSGVMLLMLGEVFTPSA